MHGSLPSTTPRGLLFVPPRCAQAPASAPAPAFQVLAFLQQQEWVVTRYALAHSDLEPYGQVTLARCHIAPDGDTGASEVGGALLNMSFQVG